VLFGEIERNRADGRCTNDTIVLETCCELQPKCGLFTMLTISSAYIYRPSRHSRARHVHKIVVKVGKFAWIRDSTKTKRYVI
jgi:hypothetical protein